jgi:predicted anti-sigma-YlaC factor YlaD
MTCGEIEDSLPSYVDGTSHGDAAAIAAHLEHCAACRASAHAQTVARTVLQSRAVHLSPAAPAGLLTRIASTEPFRDAVAPKRDVIVSFVWKRLCAFARPWR